jgi:hypothetical protein
MVLHAKKYTDEITGFPSWLTFTRKSKSIQDPKDVPPPEYHWASEWQGIFIDRACQRRGASEGWRWSACGLSGHSNSGRYSPRIKLSSLQNDIASGVIRTSLIEKGPAFILGNDMPLVASENHQVRKNKHSSGNML